MYINHKKLISICAFFFILLNVIEGEAKTKLGIIPDETCDTIVNVSDFGAIPNDSICDRVAIRKALQYSRKIGAKQLVFEEGIYDLFVGDASVTVGITVEYFNGFTMVGAQDGNGKPATKLVRHYDFKNEMFGNQILRVENCDNFKLKNFIFDNSPRYSTAGEIIAKDAGSVTIKIFEGNPVIDSTIFYTGNLWDKVTKTLKKVESLTYGSDVPAKRAEYTLRTIGDPIQRMMKMNSSTIASKVAVGDAVSWNFSWQGIQVNFLECDDLFVENVWTLNAIGFCMQAQACENITAKKVKVIAPDNQLAVGSRDGWKLNACRGNVIMDEIYMEGVRWDGQNVHGSFVWPHQLIDEKTVWFKKKGSVSLPILAGSEIGFWLNGEEVLATVSSSYNQETENNEPGFVVTFTDNIPVAVSLETLCNVYAWNIDNYTLSNSVFKNIAGCASIIRNSNVTISNSNFDHIMYPAILIGGAINEGEGIVPKNILIQNNTITNSGWVVRHSVDGAIGIRNQAKGESQTNGGLGTNLSPLIADVQIINNQIEDSIKGIVADGTLRLRVEGNNFINVNTALDINNTNNPDVQVLNNTGL